MLTYRRKNNMEVVGYSDSDYDGCSDNKNSTFGHIFLLAGRAISWKSVKDRSHTTVSHSRTAASSPSSSTPLIAAVVTVRLRQRCHRRTGYRVPASMSHPPPPEDRRRSAQSLQPVRGSVSARVRGSPKPEGVEEDEETRRLLGSHSSTHRLRRSESKRLRLAEKGVHCSNSAVDTKNRGKWKKGQSPPEICTLSRTNAGGLEITYVAAAGCRALFCLTPSEVGALNFAAILLIHCHRRSLFVVDDEGRKMMK
nr:Retrovirus-related Pol polyprotein from transposon TNT 1-94 [Ipomoea batatas]